MQQLIELQRVDDHGLCGRKRFHPVARVEAVTEGGAAALLTPVGIAEFKERYLEREVLHVTRDRPGYFSGVYGVGDVEAALHQSGREPDRFALVQSGMPRLDPEQYTIERPSVRWQWKKDHRSAIVIDPRRVGAWIHQGYSLVISDASLFSLRLQRWCNALQRELGAVVQANVYLSPPQSQGFDVHHDTHDTLTIQIEGEKRWRIYAPLVDLPLESQPFPVGRTSSTLRMTHEVTLRPGDTLYIPRGCPHDAARTASGRST